MKKLKNKNADKFMYSFSVLTPSTYFIMLSCRSQNYYFLKVKQYQDLVVAVTFVALIWTDIFTEDSILVVEVNNFRYYRSSFVYFFSLFFLFEYVLYFTVESTSTSFFLHV